MNDPCPECLEGRLELIDEHLISCDECGFDVSLMRQDELAS